MKVRQYMSRPVRTVTAQVDYRHAFDLLHAHDIHHLPVVDARVLGAAILDHGVTTAALQAYDARLCAEISAVVLRNRGAGPFGLLNLLDERCGGVFDDIDVVIPAAERAAFMHRYQTAAGFAIETLNSSPPIIPSVHRSVDERCSSTTSS